MKLKMAVIDDDSIYLKRFMSALENYSKDFNMRFFDNLEKLEQSTHAEKYDVILIKDVLFAKNTSIDMNSFSLVVVLNDTQPVSSVEENVIPVLKYQRTLEIRNRIISEYAKRCDQKVSTFSKAEGVKIIGVYSPIGGCGKTSIAQAICRKLVSMGQQTMYLNFENFSSQEDNSLNNTHKTTISKEKSMQFIEFNESIVSNTITCNGLDEVFSIISNNKDAISFIDSVKKVDNYGVFYIDSFKNIYDIYDVEARYIEQMLKAIRSSNLCKYVVVDLSTSLLSIGITVLESADSVIIVEKSGQNERNKLNRFEYVYNIAQYGDRFFSVCNFGSEKTTKFNSLGNINYFNLSDYDSILNGISSSIDISNIM